MDLTMIHIPALAWHILTWKLAVMIQVVICRPPGLGGLIQLPNPNDGGCPRDPTYGEYCDKYGSDQIKICSPCNLEQLNNPNINFPEECADLPCPYHCPQDISDPLNPAPNDSCLITTTDSLTTSDPTTVVELTISVDETPKSTGKASTATTSNLQSSTPAAPDYAEQHEWKTVLLAVMGAILLSMLIVCCVYVCMKKRKQRVPPSSSTEPMIADNGQEMKETSYAPTPKRPTMVPGQTSVTIQSEVTDMYAMLGCKCAGEPIPISPEGLTLDSLLPSTRYDVVLGTLVDTTFNITQCELIETTGELPHSACTFTLHNLMEYMEENPMEVSQLKVLFSNIERHHQETLRALAKAVGTQSLFEEVGQGLLSEIIYIDRQRRGEEDSVRVFSIQLSLRNGNAPVPDFVAEISRKLSSIHEDCVPCRHLVCQDARSSPETVV